ncbi:response regulator transcription factor [Tumebacillus flagellatus]|uniref:Transcriptional regulator n=1 Tax=Tumebacillus flagellatus TaxID=1157490 RepID=A0A074MB31_9BACL|nr:response regulator transcription factor [Tumebacillus flagellatus]KEO83117.1 transcriptional regulator [Tumebacillus flagellatus]
MTQGKRILVIEDEPNIIDVIASYLEADGYEVTAVMCGEAGLRLHAEQPFDLILLDLMLPGISGEETCKRLRATSRVSLIMLTACSTEQAKIKGLALGADDYITKPFSPRELVARVGAVLRRASPESLLAEQFHLTEQLVLDDRTKEVRRNGEVLNVTPTEFKILHTLVQHPKRTFSRSELIERVLGYDFEGEERVIDTHVKNLRKKIEEDPKNPQLVVAVYGVGYRLGDLV